MRVCRWLLGVLVLFVGLSGFAQPIPDPPEKDLCVLQGAVKFTDGTPFAGATVSVRVDGKDIMPRPVTDKDGTYTTAVPAGSATISVIGISKQAKLDVGKVNTVDFAFEKEGVVATVSYADGELVPNVNMNGRFRRENKTSASLSFVALGGGRYWFRGIPKDAQEIAILARVYVNSEQYLLQRWNLAELQPMQAVSFVVERPAPLRVLVLDADAKPLVNATITGTISYEGDQPPFWEDERTPAAARRRQPLGNRQTSADGLLDLGSWAARDYELTLRAGTMAGPARAIAVKADMETVRYALDLKPRM
ncbi:MAG TPA: carboxypeptidase-like regulatory domain-containing protein, partial [Armatimonadota bacterium]|nr:carboxypeptidase-like regulatory domain-containing protein [Armatimonadota bacterium]